VDSYIPSKLGIVWSTSSLLTSALAVKADAIQMCAPSLQALMISASANVTGMRTMNLEVAKNVPCGVSGAVGQMDPAKGPK